MLSYFFYLFLLSFFSLPFLYRKLKEREGFPRISYTPSPCLHAPLGNPVWGCRVWGMESGCHRETTPSFFSWGRREGGRGSWRLKSPSLGLLLVSYGHWMARSGSLDGSLVLALGSTIVWLWPLYLFKLWPPVCTVPSGIPCGVAGCGGWGGGVIGNPPSPPISHGKEERGKGRLVAKKALFRAFFGFLWLLGGSIRPLDRSLVLALRSTNLWFRPLYLFKLWLMTWQLSQI